MRSHLTSSSCAMLCLLAVAAPTVAAERLVAFRDVLVGNWTATLSPEDGSAKDFTDTLTFTRGSLFSSANMKAQGYEPTAYNDRASPIGIASKFDVTLTNKAGDTAKWQGEDLGGNMTGTLTVTKKDGTTTSYQFKANKAGKA